MKTLLISFFLIICAFFQPALADIKITDSHGKYHFAEPPKRVVALNWTLAENMLELGEVPVGIADIEGFNRQASRPIIPDQVVDVGNRLSPNLQAIKKLQPDIILIGYSQRPLLRVLSNISTVVYFKSFGKRYNNADKSRERFLEMAKLFDKTAFAEKKLIQMDNSIRKMRLALEQISTKDNFPTIQFMVPQNETEVARNTPLWIFGTNSMPFYAAKKLGLDVITPLEYDQFGISKPKKDDLQAMQKQSKQPICAIYLPTYQNKEASIDNTFECSFALDYQNAFGGAMSLLYLSESITKNLIGYKNK